MYNSRYNSHKKYSIEQINRDDKKNEKINKNNMSTCNAIKPTISRNHSF